MSTSTTPSNLRRHALGGLAAVFLAVGLGLWLFPGHGAGYEQTWSIALRLGTVLGLWWLAYPEIQRLPAWLWLAFPLFLLAAIFKPLRWLLLLMVPLAILLALLRPKEKHRRR